jgi:Fur family transcriptional regulator, ferric uptake regulator
LPTVLRENGLRMTPQRQVILELVEMSSGQITPEEIYQQVHARLPMVNRSTVYRTLEVFEELGIIRHIHDANGAARYLRGGEEVHLHLVCHRCGHRIDVDDTSLTEPLREALARRFGFTADFTHFAIAGRCAGCEAEQLNTFPSTE